MRMGCHKGSYRLICYSLCMAILFVTYPRPAAANPILIGLGEVIGSILTRRAALAALETSADAAFTARVTAASIQSVEMAAASRALLVPARSALRTAGKVTWGALNVAGGVMTATDLINSFHKGDLAVATDGVALGDGKYEVKVGNSTQVVDFQPTPDTPVITYGTPPATGAGASTGSGSGAELPRVVSVQNLPVNKGVETFETPSNVVQSKTLDNARAAYKVPTDTKTGDLYYVEDARLETLQNAFNLATARHYENYVWTDRSTSVSGDNTSFEYLVESRSIDVLDYSITEGSRYPALGGSLDNAVTSYTAEVPVVVHDRKINTSYTPCKYVSVTESNGSVSQKRMCTPPAESDYTVTDTRESFHAVANLNFNYTGDAFKPQEQENPVKVVDAEMLADLLSGVKLDNWTVADLLTGLLSEAALKTGYDGIPWPSGSYITDTEVADALKALGATLTASSLFTTAEDNNGKIVISNVTNIGGDTNTGTTVENKIDLGEDPKIKQPDLEETPTGKQILEPIQNSMPFLNDFKINSRDVQCPVWKFSAFGKDYAIDSHCPLIEQNRKIIETMAMIIWAFAALRVILSA